jgi:glutamate racemase
MFNCDLKEGPIGFFDSGVGGISVLKQAVSLLPNEDFIYLGDSLNAPYGVKTVNEVKELSFNAVEFLMKKGAKAIVVACNTATSAAIEELRKQYKEMPLIGIEPALKPAIELKRAGKIIIMATPMTLAEKKFSKLVQTYGLQAEIQPLPCPGLVELIEAGVIEGEEMNSFLRLKLNKYVDEDIAAIVLGCTHYPFIKNELSKVVGEAVAIIDGSQGTAKQLKRLLMTNGLLSERKVEGKIEIFNSSNEAKLINLSYSLLGKLK